MSTIAGARKNRPRGTWENEIIPAAAAIVESYDTPVTLRQLHYRLVSVKLIRNTKSEYTQLSSRTAAARRAGQFPALIDQTRKIVQPAFWSSPENAREALRRQYRRDRTEGQDWSIYLGIEKSALVEQLRHWFGRDRGIPIVPLRGYSSESFETDIIRHADEHDRHSVLLYAGDLDPSGEDIERNLDRYTDFDKFKRVALTLEQVDEYGLPRLPGKEGDRRAKRFIAKYGSLFQVELDALAPDVLRGLFADAIGQYWDDDAYASVLERERAERETL